MTTGFVLAVTKKEEDKNAMCDLMKLSEVTEAHETTGSYDLLIKIEARTEKELKDIILRKIKSLPYVCGATTIVDK